MININQTDNLISTDVFFVKSLSKYGDVQVVKNVGREI